MWVLLGINSFTQAGVQTKGLQTHWWPWNSVGVCHRKILVRWRYTSLGICCSLRFNKWLVVTQNRDWKWLLWVGKSLECSKNTILANSSALLVWVTYRISPTSNSLNKIEHGRIPAFLNCLSLLEYNVLLKQISTAPFHPRVLWSLSISWVVLKLDHIWSCWMFLFQVHDSLFMSFSDFACFSLNRTAMRHHDHQTPPLPVIPPSPACLRRILALSCTASAAISAKHRARGLCEGTCQG